MKWTCPRPDIKLVCTSQGSSGAALCRTNRISSTRHGARELGILNVALSGNTAAHDGDEVGLPELGPSGLNRLGEHVFVQPGVRTVIVELGLNDIFQHDDSPDAIVAGLQQIAVELHQHGLRVLLSTLV